MPYKSDVDRSQRLGPYIDMFSVHQANYKESVRVTQVQENIIKLEEPHKMWGWEG